MNIRMMGSQDVPDAARLHERSIRSPGSEIGHQYLLKLYRRAVAHPSYMSAHVAEIEGRVAGIILGTTDLSVGQPAVDPDILAALFSRIITGSLHPYDILSHRQFMRAAKKRLPEHYCYIESLAVDSSYRRQGIGEKLIRTIMTSHSGIPVYVDTLLSNAGARAFYRRVGFRPVYAGHGSELLVHD